MDAGEADAYSKERQASVRAANVVGQADAGSGKILLEAYYEPRFSDLSQGFRPGRGCHTALREITQRWRGVKWFIEGDIKGCLDAASYCPQVHEV